MLDKIRVPLPIAYLCLVLAQALVGMNIVSSKFLADSTPLMLQLCVRFFIAVVLIWPLYWALERSQGSISSQLHLLEKRDWFFLILQAICTGALFNLLMVGGLRFTDANVAGIITSALPAIIAIFSWLIFREKFTGIKGLCVGFATAGLLMISINNILDTQVKHSFLGDFLIFLAMFPEAFYYVLVKLYRQRLPIILMSMVMNLINGLVTLPLLILFVDFGSLNMHWWHWSIIAVLGLGSGLFFVFWCIGANRVDNTTASLSTAVVPISTVIIAWVCLGETISTLQLAGMGLVIISIMAYAASLKAKPPVVEFHESLYKENA